MPGPKAGSPVAGPPKRYVMGGVSAMLPRVDLPEVLPEVWTTNPSRGSRVAGQILHAGWSGPVANGVVMAGR